MASLNKCSFIGNLTKDPEVKYMTSGDAVANVSIACNESWKDKNGEKQESVEYVNLVFYKRLAEIAGEYLRKGSSIYADGKMKIRKYQTKEGQDRYVTEIIVNEMVMLGGKRDGATQPEATQPATEKRPAKAPVSDDFESDIPF